MVSVGGAGKRGALLAAAALGAAVCGAGLIHGWRAARAQWTYAAARYGSGAARLELRELLARGAAAERLYPWNYAFCRWIAEEAFRLAGPPERAFERAAAERWCARGLQLNPYERGLRILRARLLQARDPAAAARDWAAYTAWHFWNDYHHALLLELYAAADDVEGALAELEWVKGTPYEAEGRRRVAEVWERERAFTVPAGIGRGRPPR